MFGLVMAYVFLTWVLVMSLADTFFFSKGMCPNYSPSALCYLCSFL